MYTFVVLQTYQGSNPDVIAHVRNVAEAIRITEDMQLANLEDSFCWIMIPEVKK